MWYECIVYINNEQMTEIAAMYHEIREREDGLKRGTYRSTAENIEIMKSKLNGQLKEKARQAENQAPSHLLFEMRSFNFLGFLGCYSPSSIVKSQLSVCAYIC